MKKKETDEDIFDPFCFVQAVEAQDDLIKTKEELHMVLTVPPPPPPPPGYNHRDDNSDSEDNNSTNSTDLAIDDFNDHRKEEERLTEVEKNERVQKQLKVRKKKIRQEQNEQTKIYVDLRYGNVCYHGLKNIYIYEAGILMMVLYINSCVKKV